MSNLVFWPKIPKYGNSAPDPPEFGPKPLDFEANNKFLRQYCMNYMIVMFLCYMFVTEEATSIIDQTCFVQWVYVLKLVLLGVPLINPQPLSYHMPIIIYQDMSKNMFLRILAQCPQIRVFGPQTPTFLIFFNEIDLPIFHSLIGF